MVYYWKTDFKNGQACIPSDSDFHPLGFKGTEEKYDNKLKEIFGQFYENDAGKVIGSHKFETLEEFENKYGFNKIMLGY